MSVIFSHMARKIKGKIDKIPPQIKNQVIAYLGKGIPAVDVPKYIYKDFGKKVSYDYVLDVKNSLAITDEGVIVGPKEVITPTVIERADQVSVESKPNSLLQQARIRIAERLRDERLARDVLREASLQYQRKDISAYEYLEIVKVTKLMSITDLVSIAKEMHAQARKGDEDDDPGGTAEANAQSADQIIKKLRKAGVKSLERFVFDNK